jgi:MarR family transcriptional regulator, organic hydroperoxide resistance regulator
MNLANTTLAGLAQHPSSDAIALAVLKQFRLIYGSVRQHFRDVENSCGVSGSQLWLLHEIAHTPGIGVSELANHLSIHQSTCSQLVDKLETRGLVSKQRKAEDLRRVGLQLTDNAAAVLGAAPGPMEGVLPDALQGLTDETLEQLHASLAQVIAQLTTRDERSADKPLADL